MARVIILIFICLLVPLRVFADVQPISLSTLVTVQNVSFDQCTKVFKIDAENLFYITIAGINANRFRIDEIQSRTGYIMFNAVNKEFLASVIKLDTKTSMLKITPANNVYYFQPGIVLNIFRYIDLNLSVKPVNLPIKQ